MDNLLAATIGIDNNKFALLDKFFTKHNLTITKCIRQPNESLCIVLDVTPGKLFKQYQFKGWKESKSKNYKKKKALADKVAAMIIKETGFTRIFVNEFCFETSGYGSVPGNNFSLLLDIFQ